MSGTVLAMGGASNPAGAGYGPELSGYYSEARTPLRRAML